ncbi:hypothetical protein C0J52_19733 [Blattella germanica]|nr:hypothetical protein C0J52_19733 [Blattella germanica]
MAYIILTLVLTYLTIISHCYIIRKSPYLEDLSQIESPIIIPYQNRRNALHGSEMFTKRNIVLSDNIPAMLIEPLEENDGEGDTNNIDTDQILFKEDEVSRNGDFNFIEADSTDEFSDIPIGTPESEKEVPGEPLTPEDFENAAKLEILVPSQDEGSIDPILSAGLFEGDIAGVNISDFTPFEKNAIRDLSKRWPGGVIPYVISSSFSLYERSVIAAAVQDFHAYTCIRFVPRTTQRDYVHLLKGSGCSSLVGHFGGGQHVSLGPGCVYKGIVEHELMHACGFWHEQSRGDRDDYVRIVWQNILPGQEHNFQKFGWRISQSLGVSYDTGKVDLLKINRLYECRGGIPMPTIPPITLPKPRECKNNNRFCIYWSNTGECKRNPAWMNVNCAKACRVCDSRCGNYNRNCEVWARLGQCTKNPDYMTIYCPQACHACYGAMDENGDCKDQNRYCSAWAKNGQCRANPDYMLIFCKESCKQC